MLNCFNDSRARETVTKFQNLLGLNNLLWKFDKIAAGRVYTILKYPYAAVYRNKGVLMVDDDRNGP